MTEKSFNSISAVENFSFFVSLVIWYDVLFQISIISITMQSQNFYMCKSVKLTQCCLEFLTHYKNGLQEAISVAVELTNDLQVEPQFQSVRKLKHVESNFQYEAHDQ